MGFLAGGAYVLYQASAWPFRTAVFPLMTGFVLVGLSLVKLGGQVGRAARGTVGGGVSSTVSVEPDEDIPEIFMTASGAGWRYAASWMAAFFLRFWLFGALVTVPLFALAYLRVVASQSALLACSYALLSWAFVYGLFVRLLHIPLPPGLLLTRLGVW
jgi:hypothetical protein